MKSLLLTTVFLNCLFITAQTQSKEIELNVGFDTSEIKVQVVKKRFFIPINVLFESQNLSKENLREYTLNLMINQDETDINNQFYKLHSESFSLSELEEEKTVFLEITRDSLPDRKSKVVIDIQLIVENKPFNQINKAKYQKLEVFLKKGIPTDGPNQFHIDFVGTANLQQNISEASEEVQGSAGLGVIFERYFLRRDINGHIKEEYRNKFLESLDMEAYINVASSVDSLRADVDEMGVVTNQRNFGTYILNPVSPKQSIFINSNFFFNPELTWRNGSWITKVISGANVRVNASNILWNYTDETSNLSKYGGAISFRFGFFHEFLPNNKIRDEENKRKYSIRLGLNYSSRNITGDISSESNDTFREQFLGTTDKDFSGWEPSFGFRLNNIIAEFTMPMIGGASRSDIEGLTDTQFQFSIRFVGGFSLKVNGKEDNDEEEEN
ncbi:hypothetical protein [Flagellimonas lutimaris]|uniref:hypothetical protein n=1 Tax=Flagellimonas lutimaris TaxID=475082 RepID=UPI003F5CCC53